jgi:hypothetical protein
VYRNIFYTLDRGHPLGTRAQLGHQNQPPDGLSEIDSQHPFIA